jgi:Trk K+ transport system NAD-binding subunit
MAIPDAWIGKSLRDLSLPSSREIQVVALYDVLTDRWEVIPDPDRPLRDSDLAIVAGADEVLRALVRDVDRS